MRFAYVSIAEAATVATPDKVNALGLGVRRFVAASFPTQLNAVALAQVEASVEEFGEHPVSFSLERPNGKRELILEGTTELAQRDGFDLRRPLTWNIQFPLAGVSIDEPGGYRLRARFGKARGDYRFVVDPFSGLPESPI